MHAHQDGFLVNDGIATPSELEGIRKEADAEVDDAADRAMAIPQPAKESATLYLYSPDVDPTSKDFDTENNA